MEKETITEQRFTMLEVKLDNLTEDVKEIAKDIKDHIKWEGVKYEKLDNKYSAKWVETGVIAITTALIIAAIVGLFNFFIK